MDKNGVCLGTLTIGQAQARRSYAIDLLSNGFAHVDDYSADRGGNANALYRAQEEAQTKKLKIWSIEEKTVEPTTEVEEVSEEFTKVNISDIVDGGQFWIQNVSDNGLKLVKEKMDGLLAEVGTAGAPFEPSKNKLCAALYDGEWYRARVVDTKPDGIAVHFIDYGNIS